MTTPTSTTNKNKQWMCRVCQHRMENLTPEGKCWQCGAFDVTIDLGGVENRLAQVMGNPVIELNNEEATELLHAVTKVLIEHQIGGLAHITTTELACLNALRHALIGTSMVH